MEVMVFMGNRIEIRFEIIFMKLKNPEERHNKTLCPTSGHKILICRQLDAVKTMRGKFFPVIYKAMADSSI